MSFFAKNAVFRNNFRESLVIYYRERTSQGAGSIVCVDLRGPKAMLLLMLALTLVDKDHKQLKKYFVWKKTLFE